jgi:phage N-6-adenine-methyltransferase
MINKGLFSSNKQDWCTPQQLYDELNREFNFVADVSATEENKKAPFCYTPETDGLKQTWVLGGPVFCNPPYGNEIKKWVKKAYEESQKGATVVMLIPARTDTSYFHDYIYNQAEIRFLRGRIHFTDQNGNNTGRAPFPSMVVIWRNK